LKGYILMNDNKLVNDMGWEIYPRGLYEVLKELKRYNKPIYILENGLADSKDEKRGDFIVDHLRYIHQAIKEDIKVRGYFHWSLLDNLSGLKVMNQNLDYIKLILRHLSVRHAQALKYIVR